MSSCVFVVCVDMMWFIYISLCLCCWWWWCDDGVYICRVVCAVVGDVLVFICSMCVAVGVCDMVSCIYVRVCVVLLVL